MPPPETPLPLPLAEALLTSLTTFLQTTLHTLLYHRALYPPRTFLPVRAYNLPVHQSRHPAVREYLASAVSAVRTQIRTGKLKRFALVVIDPGPGLSRNETEIETKTKDKDEARSQKNNDENPPSKEKSSEKNTQQKPDQKSLSIPPTPKVLEKWVFDIPCFPPWPEDLGANTDDNNGQIDENPDLDDIDSADSPVNWADVHEHLRGALRRIAYAAERMPALPSGATFTLTIELEDDASAPIGHPQPWIASDASLQDGISTQDSHPTTRTIPIRSVSSGPLFFECWVEEAESHPPEKSTQET